MVAEGQQDGQQASTLRRALEAVGGTVGALILFLQFRGVDVNPWLAFAALALVFWSIADPIWTSQRTRRLRTPLKIVVTTLLLGLCVFAWKVTEHTGATDMPVQSAQQSRQGHKYSSTQVIQWSDEPGNYTDSGNLDNVATLVVVGTPSIEAVELLLPADAPRQTDFKPGDMKPGGPPVVTSQTVFSGGLRFTFGPNGPNRSHIVAVASRRFLVTLLAVKSAPTPSGDTVVLTYTFGISEQ